MSLSNCRIFSKRLGTPLLARFDSILLDIIEKPGGGSDKIALLVILGLRVFLGFLRLFLEAVTCCACEI